MTWQWNSSNSEFIFISLNISLYQFREHWKLHLRKIVRLVLLTWQYMIYRPLSSSSSSWFHLYKRFLQFKNNVQYDITLLYQQRPKSFSACFSQYPLSANTACPCTECSDWLAVSPRLLLSNKQTKPRVLMKKQHAQTY